MYFGIFHAQKRHGYNAQRQSGMRQNAKQRVGGQQALGAQPDERHGKSNGDENHAELIGDANQQTNGHAQKRGMRQTIAEIGHAAPNNETAQRARQ